MCYRRIILFAISLFICGPVLGQSLSRLYDLSASEDGLLKEQRQRLLDIKDEPASGTVAHFMLNNPVSVLTKPEFELIISDETTINARTRGITRKSPTSLVWQGNFGDDPTIVTLILTNGDLLGHFRAEDMEWRFQPLGGGANAIVSHNYSYLEENPDPSGIRVDGSGEASIFGKAPSNESSAMYAAMPVIETIDILVVYSDDAQALENMASAAAGYVSQLQTAINNAGLGHKIQVALVHSMEVTITEPIADTTALDDLVNGNSPFGGVASARTTHGADIVVFVADQLTGSKGLSEDIFATSASLAFSVVERGPANSAKTFSHEVGHLVGGLHEIQWMKDKYGNQYVAADAIGFGTVPHAHGYNDGSDGTLLNVYSGRVNYFSTPDQDFPGTSTPMGDGDEANVVQVWDDNSDTIAGLVAAVVEEVSPPWVLEASISGETERKLHESITLYGGSLYYNNEDDRVCDDCLYRWYDRDDPADPWDDTGVTTETYYDSMTWTETHYFGVTIADGIQDDEATHSIDYCPTECSGQKTGDGLTDEDGETPFIFELSDAYPNPFNPTTNISFSIPEAGHVTLEVFDAIGRRIETIVDHVLDAGPQLMSWDAKHRPSGIYLLRLSAAGQTETKTVTLTK